MKKIYKYQLELVDYQSVIMPTGAKILSAQFQTGALCMWAEVNVGLASIITEEVFIEIYGTGHDLTPTPKKYISTVQEDGLVWHVYRKG